MNPAPLPWQNLRAAFEPLRLPARLILIKWEQGRPIMQAKTWHWLDYDPIALAVLVIGLAAIELLALSI
jgi:hypothetical protein